MYCIVFIILSIKFILLFTAVVRITYALLIINLHWDQYQPKGRLYYIMYLLNKFPWVWMWLICLRVSGAWAKTNLNLNYINKWFAKRQKKSENMSRSIKVKGASVILNWLEWKRKLWYSNYTWSKIWLTFTGKLKAE